MPGHDPSGRYAAFSVMTGLLLLHHSVGHDRRPPESLFDFVQGITALARAKSHQDSRLDLENKAKKLMERAA
ncbi:hypothetical protein GALL_245330 [mine drainage metagenome]|uniref:Uncharacterized protein n=1 Tax=mine drainage metagenome TaxID=410659 RepID=A0A1J5RN16_9ZZZZ